MKFEIDHEGIKTALKEYMQRRGILENKDFTMHIKTSRKGLKTSRALIELVDVSVQTSISENDSRQLELDLEEESVSKTTEIEEEAGLEAKSTPFKKLFAC